MNLVHLSLYIVTPYYCFVHVVLVPFGLVYVPIPPPAAKYLSRKSPGNVVYVGSLPNESLAIVPLKITLVRLLQLLNAAVPIDVMPVGMLMLVRLVQLENALSPIDVTLSGMVMSVRLLQPVNAAHPIDVTPSGMLMLVRLLQVLNAEVPIDVTPAGMLMLVRLVQL